ncbi:MAG TPA: bifunctional DNA primase/polymerase [Stellaceae bacterium]|nr:bifunctional DNA primase/polymerase [Stellaceae bacterium]
MTAFADAAPLYAAQGAVPIPCGGEAGKQPLIPWGKLKGAPSAACLETWGRKFPHANVGIVTGPSRLTVVDVDDADLAEEIESRCGHTPLVTRTPRGGLHFWYRGSGERSLVGLEGRKIDVRGIGGFVVAPPSRRPDGAKYTIERGCLEDLARLPQVLPGILPLSEGRGPVDGSMRPAGAPGLTPQGARNNHLFRALLLEAPRCRSLEELEFVARKLNNVICDPPLSPSEVEKIARSAWRYQVEGRNWVGGDGVIALPRGITDRLWDKCDAMVLMLRLQADHFGIRERFAVSPRAMAAAGVIPGWGEKRYRSARARLLERGCLVEAHHGGRGERDPSLFAFGRPGL